MYGQSLSRRRVATFVIGVVVLSASVVFAEDRYRYFLRPIVTPFIHIPPLVRFTGTLHPAEEKDDDGLHTLWFSVRRKELQFRLLNVEVLTGTNYGSMILSDIFPRRLRLSAPRDILSLLERPEIVGKFITLEGRLYKADRILLVTALEEVPEYLQ